MKERRRQVGLILCFGFLFVISVRTSLAQTEVSGEVAGVWKLLESPFIVKDDISVMTGDTLRIEAGVKILFDGHFEFSIKGLLRAVGTDADSITFTHNAPGSTWAGIRFSEADKNSILEYCTIEYSDQSGITIFRSSITVKHNTIRDNQDIGAQFQVGMGGGIYVSFSAPLIAENYIVNNSAERGGGIEYNEDGRPNRCEILNNIIVSNSASTLGGGIRVFGPDFGATPLIRNNVLDMNTAQLGGNIYVFPGARPEIVNNIITNSSQGSGIFDLGNANIRYNDVWNNQPFDYEFTNPGQGDFSADPLFVGGAPLDYHLQEASPCIDVGDPNTPLDPDNSVSDIGAFFFGEDLPPISVTGFEAFPSDQKVLLQWQNPNLIDYSSTRLLRRSDRFPMDPEDGDIIFEGNKFLFQDTGVQNSTEYFYVAFAKDKANQFSEASFANAVPEAGISTVIRVPIDFITIQEGLNAASPGDTVLVYRGTYSPATNGEVFPIVLADGVVLMSKSGRDSTIVDAAQINLVFMGANDASIQGFTITGGWNFSIKPTSTGIYSEPAGGAILCVDVMNMKIVNNMITGNVADGPFFPDGYGGGIFCFRSEVTIRGNVISDNFAERDHGGISCVGDPSPPTVLIENNQILRNRGGGLGLDGIHAVVEGNLIAENIVTGAGIPIPGGIDLGTFFWGSVKIMNNTIAFNYNSQLPGNISGVYFTSGTQPIELVNNIIWGHDDRGGKEIAGLGQSVKDLLVSYCDIEGGFPGTGNIPTEPLFVDPLNGNYHLQENSPCIDAGDPTFLPNSDGTRADIGVWPFFHTGTSQIDVTPDQFIVHVNQQTDITLSLQISNTGDWPLRFKVFERIDMDGQDEYGYSYIDSDLAANLAVDWTDIRSVGTQLDFTGFSKSFGPLDLGFTMNFYEQDFATVNVTSNGFLSFTSNNHVRANQPLPFSLGPENLVAPFWDSFLVIDGDFPGEIFYFADDANKRFIVQFDSLRHEDASSGRETFQAILKHDGSIVYQYKNTSTSGSATIGTQNNTGQFGLQVAYNEDFIHDNFAIKIFQGAEWLILPPSRYVLHSGESVEISFTVNTSNLQPEYYDSQIVLETNDPDDAFLIIPVHLNINDPDGDVTAPAAVHDLFISDVTDSSTTLRWTAPGDDGLSGVAFQYDLRYATIPPAQDTTAWWESATPVTALPSPSFSGKVDSVKVTELNTSLSHYFAIRTSDEAGNLSVISNIAFSLPVSVESTDANIVPRKFDLSQNYPNPFNPETTIKYQIPRTADVSLEIYNLLGQRLATLVKKRQPAGFYDVMWNGKDDFGSQVASGVYLYRLQAGEFFRVRKLTLLR